MADKYAKFYAGIFTTWNPFLFIPKYFEDVESGTMTCKFMLPCFYYHLNLLFHLETTYVQMKSLTNEISGFHENPFLFMVSIP